MSTAALPAVDNQNPWPGLSAFDETAENFFNGRANEIAELRRLVLNAPLTVLFGTSGLGKTSLIQAGLFPSMRKQHFLPVYIRLDVRDRSAPLLDQVTLAFQQQMRLWKVDAPRWREQESLWEYLHAASFELWSVHNQLLTPLFVFDQFEEVCTLGLENASAIRQLRIDLADIIENRIPEALARSLRSDASHGDSIAVNGQRYKVILSFREDFLPSLEGWKRDIPSMMKNRLRLLPMSQRQAFEAVYQTAPSLVTYDLAREIVDFVSAARDSAAGLDDEILPESAGLDVEPALLSLVCHGLNETRKAHGKAAFDRELLSGSKESIIADFYRKSIADMPSHVRRFIREELITDRGFRKPCYVDDAHTRYGVTDRQLSLLVDRRLLRIEPFRGTERVELTHDLLTGVVRIDRDRERARRHVTRSAVFAALALVLALSAFGVWYLISERAKDEALRKEAEWQAELADFLRTQALKKAQDASVAERNAELSEAHAVQARMSAEHSAADADRERKVAIAARTASQALSAQQPDLALLLAAESTRNGDEKVGFSSLLSVLQTYPNLQVMIRDHMSPVASLAFNADNLTSSDYSGKILIHNTEGLKTGETDSDSRRNPTLSPDGRYLASRDALGVGIWNAAGQKIQEFSAAQLFAFSGDSRFVGLLSQDKLSVRHLTLWDLVEKKSSTWDMNPSNVGGRATAIALNANASRLAVWNSLPAKPDWIDIWDIKSSSAGPVPLTLNLDTRGTGRIQFNSKGDLLAYTAPDGRLGLWSMESSRGSTLMPNWQAVSIAFSPDGALLASGGKSGDVRLWKTGAMQANWSQHLHSASVTSIAFSPDSRTLASAASTEIALSSVSQSGVGEPLHDSQVNEWTNAITFTPDNRLVAYGLAPGRSEASGVEGFTRVWNMNGSGEPSPNEWSEAGGRSALGVSPNGQIAVSGKRGGGRPCDIGDLTFRRTDRNELQDPTLSDLKGLPNICVVAFDPLHGQPVVAFQQDSSNKGGPGTYQIAGWHPLKTAKELSPVPTLAPITALAVSPDGKILAAAAGEFPSPQILLWASKPNDPSVLQFHGNRISNLAFSPDSKNLVSAEDEGVIDVWRIYNRKHLAHLSDTYPSNDLAFSPDGKLLAAGKIDGIVTLWDTQAWERVGTFRAPDATGLVTLAFNPKDSKMLAYSAGKAVWIWKIDLASLKTKVCHIAKRNLSYSEWQQFGNGPYQKTCPDLPIHPSVLEYAHELARRGDNGPALELFRRAKDLDPAIHLDPNQEVAKDMSATRAQDSVFTARQSYKEHPLEALKTYHAADQVDPTLVQAVDWNNVCWAGSTRGFARQVIEACNRAVDMDKENLGHRDSRGLARALTGDTQGAVADFEAFVTSTAYPEPLKQQRQDWINKLNARQNPFTPELLKDLQSQ